MEKLDKSFSEKLDGKFFSAWKDRKKKNAGLWFATCVSAQPDTMPNVTI